MIIDGKKISAEIKAELFKRLSGKNLAVALVAVDIDSVGQKFISMKKQTAEEVGVEFKFFEYENDITKEDLETEIKNLARRSDINGIVVQLPLPDRLKEATADILNLIPPDKDIDSLGQEAKVLSPVAVAVREILDYYNVDLVGKKIAVLGRGKLVGLPVAKSLAPSGGEVESFGKDSKGMLDFLTQADIVVSGMGESHLIKPEMVKEGTILIDAGTSESSGRVVGDIDPSCADKVSLFSPVPGGVGPIALACLFKNLAELQNL